MGHTAKSLFDMNIQSSQECLNLYDGIIGLKSGHDASWLLRSVIVFSISALDAYFHDKIKYRVGYYVSFDEEKHSDFQRVPEAMQKFPILLRDLQYWDRYTRKSVLIQKWFVDYYSTRPLQDKNAISEALKTVDIKDLWNTLEPEKKMRDDLLAKLKSYVKRRHEIAHEGDRQSSRKSGKKIRPINRQYAASCMQFIQDLVQQVESKFPN